MFCHNGVSRIQQCPAKFITAVRQFDGDFSRNDRKLDGLDYVFSKTVICFQLNLMLSGFIEPGNCNLKLLFAKMILGAIELELRGCQ